MPDLPLVDTASGLPCVDILTGLPVVVSNTSNCAVCVSSICQCGEGGRNISGYLVTIAGVKACAAATAIGLTDADFNWSGFVPPFPFGDTCTFVYCFYAFTPTSGIYAGILCGLVLNFTPAVGGSEFQVSLVYGVSGTGNSGGGAQFGCTVFCGTAISCTSSTSGSNGNTACVCNCFGESLFETVYAYGGTFTTTPVY